ncbi:MAG: FtsW/RodA/SpoVE family cell cycle protein [Chloroflexota bacterium]
MRSVLAAARLGRWRQLALLAFPLAFCLLAELDLAGADRVRFGWVLVFACCLLAAHIATVVWSRHADGLVLPSGAVLSAVGLVLSRRLDPSLLTRELIWTGAGTAVLCVLLARPRAIEMLRDYRYVALVFGLLLLAVTVVVGSDPNGSGARLWIRAGGLTAQPSELVKLILVGFLASFLDEHRAVLRYGRRFLGVPLSGTVYLVPMAAAVGFSVLLLVLQRDLGAGLIFFGTAAAMLYLASASTAHLLASLTAFVAAALVAYERFSHVQLRVAIWLDPWVSRDTGGYQIVQGLAALAAGGLFGAGLGAGRPDLVPAAHTDYVIAVIGEELGLVGSLAVVMIYAVLVTRGFAIAAAAAPGFDAMLAAGVTSLIAIQTIVILAGTVRLLPLTGVTLPLVSYGGSSAVVTWAGIGMLIWASHRQSGVGRGA